MADTLEIGALEAEIRLNAEQAEQAAEQTVRAFREIGQAGLDAQKKVDPLAPLIDKVGVSGTNAAAGVSSLDSAVKSATSGTAALDNSLENTAASAKKTQGNIEQLANSYRQMLKDEYAGDLDKLNSTFEIQADIVDTLRGKMDALWQKYLSLGGNAEAIEDLSAIAPKLQAEYDEELAYLNQLELEIKDVTAAREAAAATAVSTANQQVAATDKTTKSAKSANMTFDTTATAIRAVTSAAGSGGSTIGYLATEVMYLKRQMSAATTTATAMTAALSFGLMAAVTLVSVGVQKLQEAEEQRQKQFETGIQNFKQYSEELQTLESNLKVLQDNNSTTEELTSARKTLASTFSDLILGYTEEGEAILASNELIEKQIALTQKRLDMARQVTLSTGKTEADDYQQRIQDIQYYEKYIAEFEKELATNERAGQILTTAFTGKSLDGVLDYASLSAQTLDEAIAYGKEKLSELYDLQAQNEEKTSSFFQAYLEKSIAIADAQTGVINNIDSLDSKTYTVANARIAELKLEIENGLLTYEEAATQLNNDLSDSSFVDNYYTNLINSTNNATIAANALATAYDNVNSTASSALSAMTNAQSDLADAYAELAENGKLAQSTVVGLLSDYPQLIKYLDTQTGQLNLTEDVMREIFELQKAQQILDLQAAKDKLIANKETIDSNLDLAESELTVAKARLAANGGTWNAKQYANAESALKDAQAAVEDYKDSLSGIDKLMEYITGLTFDPTGTSSSGSSSGKSAYETALEELNYLDKMDQLTTEEKIKRLKAFKTQYSLTADELKDLNYQIYAAEKEYTAEIEQAHTDALNEQYEQIENKKSLNQLTAEAELAWLQKIRAGYQMSAEERIALEIKIYNLKQELQQNEIDALDDLGAAITDALKAKYEDMRESEEKRINESIKAWEKWEDDTVDAIQGEIDALDELEKQQESQEAAAEYARKAQELQMLAAYETDDYQRKQYEKQLAALAEEEADRLADEAREAKKAELQEQIETTKSTAEARKEELQAELDVINANIDELTSTLALRAEAEKTIMESSQTEIVALIKSYAPEYAIAGQTIGESLYNAMTAKVNDALSYVESAFAKVESYASAMKSAATQAADEFEATYKANQAAGSTTTTQVINQTVNINQPVESPIATKRAVDAANESLTRSMLS